MIVSCVLRGAGHHLHRHACGAAVLDWGRRAAATLPPARRARRLRAQHAAEASGAATMTQLEAEKRRVREQVKAALRQLSVEQMAAESSLIAARVLASKAFRSSPHAIIYVHCAKLREVDTTSILEAAMADRKRLYVPRVQDKDANMHFLHLDSWAALREVPPFGIREPRPTYDDGREREDVLLVDEPLELVVMPGLAFDRAGRRLGRGGGYYDKFIHAARAHAAAHGWAPPLLMALSYRPQLVDAVPVEPHDVGVDAIVTPDEVIVCTGAGSAALPTGV